jgi:hypothetical protein
LNSSRSVSERFGIKNTLESWISSCVQIRDRNTTRGCCKVVRGRRIQQAIAAERKSPACEDVGEITGGGPSGITAPQKNKAVRRSITPTALPAPDIEIGLRRPVEATMPRILAGKCDPVHSRQKKLRGPKKVAASPWGKNTLWLR